MKRVGSVQSLTAARHYDPDKEQPARRDPSDAAERDPLPSVPPEGATEATSGDRDPAATVQLSPIARAALEHARALRASADHD